MVLLTCVEIATEANALRISATESPSGSGLASIDNTTTNSSKQKIVIKQQLLLAMTLSRTSNEVDDLFEGYTVNLTTQRLHLRN